MIANDTEHAPRKNRHHASPARPLWYAPDRRLRTKHAADQAIRVAEQIGSADGPQETLGEEVLFVSLHTCAFQVNRRAARPAERTRWTRRWETIREYIVQRNLGLVYSMIGRFSTRRTDEDDLLSDAMLALTRAADRFNPWRGYRFSTYACNVIARALMRRGKRETNYRRLFPVQHDVSFERADTPADLGSDLYVERLRSVLDNNLGALTEIESRILAQRFPASREGKLTFQEIGNAVGLSKERVRQIQNVALSKLREVLTGDPILQ
ncbi:MAG: sigma-70 family RNA polymerase sigma factor [Planctomycetes bacterium]|nr:sigma-70 family RNA polymerase sigma factor [Planctomycetota bacterium]